jgi:uncharacterized membrane protein YdjX (TVP38/TMEM64 family)
VPEGPPGQTRQVALRIAAVVIVAAAVVGLWLAGVAPSSGELRDWGDDLGVAGPVLWPVVFAVVNFVVPWPIIAGATGAVFGTAAGTPIALAGVLLAAVLQFGVARTTAGEHLRRRVLARVPRIDALLDRNGFLAVFYSRIIPGIAWGPVNYAAGLSRVRLRDVLLATVAGGTPKVFAYVSLGGSFDDLGSPEAIVAVSLLVVLALAGLVLARKQFRKPA